MASGSDVDNAAAYPRNGSSAATSTALRHAASRPETQSHKAFALRPGVTSSSRATGPDRSTMPRDEQRRAMRVRGQERRLVHAEPSHALEVGRVLDQREAVLAHRVHDGLPADAVLRGDASDGLAVLPDSATGLAARPLTQARPRPDRLARLRPGLSRARRFVAAPDPLEPDQRHRPPTGRQITHVRAAPVMQPRHHTAARAAGHRLRRLDRVLELVIVFRPGEQHKARQAEHHRRRSTVVMHLGPPLTRVHTPRILRPQGPTSAHVQDRAATRPTTLDREAQLMATDGCPRDPLSLARRPHMPLVGAAAYQSGEIVT